MTAAGNGQGDVSEDKQYLVPREISPRGREVLFRPASKAHSVEDGTAEFLPSATKGGGTVLGAPPPAPPTIWQQAGAALFYATASLMVIFVNKVWL